MTQVSSNIVDLFDAATADFTGVDPRTSGFPVRPPAGDHACVVTGIEAKAGTNKTKSGMAYDTAEITFRFETSQPLEGQNEPLEFIGRSFKLPKNMKVITEEGTQKYLEGERARLCGHLTTILGRKVVNVAAALSEAKALVESKRTEVIVACQYEQDKKKPDIQYFKEFLTENLSLAAAQTPATSPT